jgi:hypothetical protein
MGQLTKGHVKELLPAGKVLRFEVSFVSANTGVKHFVGRQFHDLREDIFTLVHSIDNQYFKASQILPIFKSFPPENPLKPNTDNNFKELIQSTSKHY